LYSVLQALHLFLQLDHLEFSTHGHVVELFQISEVYPEAPGLSVSSLPAAAPSPLNCLPTHEICATAERLYGGSYMIANCRFRTLDLTLLIAFVLGGLSEPAQTVAATNKTRERLIERAELAEKAFLSGDFDTYFSLNSEPMRRLFREQSDAQLNEIIKNWKGFTAREEPQYRILGVEIKHLRGRVKKEVRVKSSRKKKIVFDRWVYESGDWWLDDAPRIN
jgi:hypothetical protein